MKEVECHIARLEIKPHCSQQNMRNTRSVDICFLVDSTASMCEVISETKTVIDRTLKRLSQRIFNLTLRCAFVGYRDFSDGSDKVCVFPFNENTEAFKTFVSGVRAFGGGDVCEDVFGGLEQVNKLEWVNMSRVLFHVADAPCHGRRFHNYVEDYYPNGDPQGRSIKKLLGDLTARNVEYYFAEMNKLTTKMIDEFNKELNMIKKLQLTNLKDLPELVADSIAASIRNYDQKVV